jgi:hypothetical protein
VILVGRIEERSLKARGDYNSKNLQQLEGTRVREKKKSGTVFSEEGAAEEVFDILKILAHTGGVCY